MYCFNTQSILIRVFYFENFAHDWQQINGGSHTNFCFTDSNLLGFLLNVHKGKLTELSQLT